MSNIGPITDIRIKAKVIETCWQYVFENFHKFKEHNKIKVALAILLKDIPDKIEGNGLPANYIITRVENKTAAPNPSTGQVHILP